MKNSMAGGKKLLKFTLDFLVLIAAALPPPHIHPLVLPSDHLHSLENYRSHHVTVQTFDRLLEGPTEVHQIDYHLSHQDLQVIIIFKILPAFSL